MKGKLTDQQERFAREYVVDLNATQAAIRAGYSPGPDGSSVAQVQGSRLLSTAMVQARVQELHRPTLERSGVTAEAVIAELAAIAFSDVRRLVDQDGKMRPLADLDDATAASISSIDIQSGEGGATVSRLRTWSKSDALRELLRRVMPELQAHVVFSPQQLAVMEPEHLDMVEQANKLLAQVSDEVGGAKPDG
jgi:phage terminase small subunit